MYESLQPRHSPLNLFLQENEREFQIPYRPCTSPGEVLKKSLLPYLPLTGLPVPHAEMLNEALRLEQMAVAHRSYGEDNSGWKSLVLHGLGSQRTQGAEHYGLDPDDSRIYDWTEIAGDCPVTVEFLKSLRFDYFHRVRFMFLEPRGSIAPHQDTEDYYLGPINLALNQPDHCRFVMKSVGVVPFQPGQMNKLALCNQHAVINDSPITRIHMIIHGSPNPDFWHHVHWRSYEHLIRSHSRFFPRT